MSEKIGVPIEELPAPVANVPQASGELVAQAGGAQTITGDLWSGMSAVEKVIALQQNSIVVN